MPIDLPHTEVRQSRIAMETHYEEGTHWPVNWSAVWSGALASIAVILVLGLIGIAIGAHLLTPEHRVVDLKKMGFGTLAFSVCSSFLAFVVGGWVAGKVAGIWRAESAMLHGAIAWLVAVPALVALAGLGAGTSLGAWQAGLATSRAGASDMPFERPDQPAANASPEDQDRYRTELAGYRKEVKQWKEDTPRVTRNTALGAVTGLLLGLIGSVLGGWMASGEPMHFGHYRSQTPGRERAGV